MPRIMHFLNFVLPLLPLTAFLTACTAGPESIRRIPDEKKLVLLVESFQNNSVEGAKWNPWKLGFASLVQEDLVVSGYFRVVSEESRRKALGEQAFQESGLTPETGMKTGKLLGAQWILAGGFVVAGPEISVHTDLMEVESGRVLATIRRTGASTEFFTLSKQMSIELLKQLRLDFSEEDVRYLTQSVETKDVDASLLNYEGEMALRRIDEIRYKKAIGRADTTADVEVRRLEKEARRRFRDAVEEDPDYRRARQNLQRLALMLPSSI